MGSWILFGIFIVIEFIAFVLAMAEIVKGSGVFSMGGRFMIIAPVAFLGPLMSDWIFLDGAITGMKYGKIVTSVFVAAYVIYIIGGFILGALLAKMQEEKKQVESEKPVSAESMM